MHFSFFIFMHIHLLLLFPCIFVYCLAYILIWFFSNIVVVCCFGHYSAVIACRRFISHQVLLNVWLAHAGRENAPAKFDISVSVYVFLSLLKIPKCSSVGSRNPTQGLEKTSLCKYVHDANFNYLFFIQSIETNTVCNLHMIPMFLVDPSSPEFLSAFIDRNVGLADWAASWFHGTPMLTSFQLSFSAVCSRFFPHPLYY